MEPDVARPEVSVIIVNWNTRDLLRDCLRSIADQTSTAHQVIVIDNASRDGSAAMVRAEFPETVLIANADNRGFAAANNQGLAIAQGGHVLLLNPDTIVLDHAIDKMLAWLADHPGVGCAGCQVLEGPGAIQRTCFSDPGLAHMIVAELGLTRLARWIPALGWPWYSGWDRRSERAVDVVSGMFMLVPRAVVDKVGPLDDAFFIYSEEADWCRRIRKAGWTCVFTPAAQIIHLDGGSKSTDQVRPKMFIQLQKSHLIYIGKHDGALARRVMAAVFVLSAALRSLLFGFLSLWRRDNVTKAHIQLSHTALAFHLLGREPVS